VSFALGDLVYIVGLGKALWEIIELGDQSFYDSGEPLSESPTKLSLYLPEPHLPRLAYPQQTYSHREFMHRVPAMMVLALEASAPRRTPTQNLLIEQHFNRRLKEKLKLEDKCKSSQWAQLALDRFREENPDLFYKQVSFQTDCYGGGNIISNSV